MKSEFSHVKNDHTPHMVDVSTKNSTTRTARALARVDLGEEIAQRLVDNDLHLPKGPVFQTAILAGIMAAKRTADLIPLCHTLPIESVHVHIEMEHHTAVITTDVRTFGKTGVEMEALTAASVAALTIYDMCKAISPDMTIGTIQLLEKIGGKNDFRRNA